MTLIVVIYNHATPSLRRYNTSDGRRYGFEHSVTSNCDKRVMPGIYLDNTLEVYHCHDAHGTNGLPNVNMTNQWHRAW